MSNVISYYLLHKIVVWAFPPLCYTKYLTALFVYRQPKALGAAARREPKSFFIFFSLEMLPAIAKYLLTLTH